MQQTKVSASQIGVWNDCQRRWGYEYLDGLRPPPNASAELGSKVHAILEGVIKSGAESAPTKLSKPHSIAKRAEHFALELASRGAKVEHKFDFEFGGVVYGGFVDAHVFKDGELLIVDWKTSSDPAKWGLTDETITSNTQAVIYSMWGVTEYPVDRVHLHWHYLNTRSSELAKPAQAILSKSYISTAFAELAHKPACEISKGRKKAAVDLPQNFSSCGKYGGCPHIERCHGTATPQERLKSLMSQALRAPGHIPKALQTETTSKESRMSLLAMLEDEDTKPDENVGTSSQVPTPASNDAPASTDGDGPAREKWIAEGAPGTPPPSAAAPLKRGKGRPKGAKNKPKPPVTDPAGQDSMVDDISDLPPETPTPTCPASPRAELFDECLEHCLKQLKLATDGSDARCWVDAYNSLKMG